ncbi:MAG: hypothetical protein ACI9HX_000069, partial [Pseudoalteromonas tetraodonis]|jgi:hypothetical protein
MRLTLSVIGAGALTALTACGTSSPEITELPLVDDLVWAVFDELPSGRANQGVITKGEFVGTDEIHFARGANADGIYHEQYYAPNGEPPEPSSTTDEDDVYRHLTYGAFGADRAAHNGDYLLPTDTTTWPDFTADLAFFRMEASETELFIQLHYASFPSPNAQIATVTITPTVQAPAVADWPRNAGIGSDYAIALTVWGDGGELASNDGSSATLADLGGDVRVTDHAIEARLPLSSLPAGPWRIGVGSGLADPADHSMYWTVPAGAPNATSPGTDGTTQPGSNVWDLMFTPHDPRWHDDHIQGDLLLNRDASTATVVVDPAQLQARTTTIAPPITGRITHTYQSKFDFGDGIARGAPSPPPVPAAPTPAVVKPRDAGVSYEYLSGVQPSFVYVPEDYATSSDDWPLVLYLHGLNNYIWEPFGLTLGIEDKLDQHRYLFASTLGRGDISYTDRGELDPLELIEHMAARYRIDRSRIYILGHSHGGGGVMNISRRNPDKFAAVVSAQIMNTSELPENYRYINTIHIAGAQDPIDNGPGAQSRYDGLSALGYDTQLYQYQTRTHENASIYDAITQIFDLFERSQQPQNPAIVTFTRAGGDINEALGLLHNSAYWVSEMVAANESQNMSVNATSFAIPHSPLDPSGATKNGPALLDTEGESGRSLSSYSQTIPAYGDAAEVANRADLTLSNVTEITLDIDRMNLSLTAGDASISSNLTHDLLMTLSGISPSQTRVTWSLFDGGNILSDNGSSPIVNGKASIPVTADTRLIEFQ